MNKTLLSLCLLTFFFSCKTDSKKTAITEASLAGSAENEWITLFDGTSLDGWRGYNMDNLPPGHIALQDHSSPIWFRNIKIKKL